MYKVILKLDDCEGNKILTTPRRFQYRNWANRYKNYINDICRREYDMIEYYYLYSDPDNAKDELIHKYHLSSDEIDVVLTLVLDSVQQIFDLDYFGYCWVLEVVKEGEE